MAEFKKLDVSMLETSILEEKEKYFKKIEEDDKKALLESHYKESSSGVNPKYWNESIDTFIPRSDSEKYILDVVKNYVSENKQNKMLLMCGNFGTGKTHLGCGIIREKGGVIIPSLKLIIEYESAANFRAEKTKLQVLEYYSTQKMLVIDEIGRGIKKDTEMEILAYILSMRYENLLPTVLITNLSKTDFVKSIGNAIYDRMTETCICLNFDGKSHRLTQRGEM